MQVKRALKGKAQCETVWGHTLYHPEDVPFKLDMSDLPDTFTPARHKVSSQLFMRKHAYPCCILLSCPLAPVVQHLLCTAVHYGLVKRGMKHA